MVNGVRVSKDPQVRRQEMLDTAMKLFSRQGYEVTTMADIAREMSVVPGLCYRYFSSKQDLYETALDEYVSECIEPLREAVARPCKRLEEFLDNMAVSLVKKDDNGHYHDFFYKDGNDYFKKQFELMVVEKSIPYVVKGVERCKADGIIKTQYVITTAKFIMYGQFAVVNDDMMTDDEKVEKIKYLFKKVLV